MTLYFATALPVDVIMHAQATMPNALVIHLRNLSEQHAAASISTHNKQASVSALRLSFACLRASKLLAVHKDAAPALIMKGGMGMWIPAYDAACHVLNLPRPLRADIVARWQGIELQRRNAKNPPRS